MNFRTCLRLPLFIDIIVAEPERQHSTKCSSLPKRVKFRWTQALLRVWALDSPCLWPQSPTCHKNNGVVRPKHTSDLRKFPHRNAYQSSLHSSLQGLVCIP